MVTETLMPKVMKPIHNEGSPSVKLLQVQGSQLGGKDSQEQYSKMTQGPHQWGPCSTVCGITVHFPA